MSPARFCIIQLIPHHKTSCVSGLLKMYNITPMIPRFFIHSYSLFATKKSKGSFCHILVMSDWLRQKSHFWFMSISVAVSIFSSLICRMSASSPYIGQMGFVPGGNPSHDSRFGSRLRAKDIIQSFM